MLKKLNPNTLVSVIIPTYNEEKHIKKCIEAIKSQTFKHFEIIIVDDGSTDLTKKIILKEDVRLFCLLHGGPGQAKNFGAKMAKGKIIVFVDADIVIDKNYLKKIINPIITGKAICTHTLSEYVGNVGNIWSNCWNINSNLPKANRIPKKDKTNGVAFRAIRKDIFLKLGGFNPKLGYIDDRSLSKQNIISIPVVNAKCYHYNPETLSEVFYSARWIGRSVEFQFNVRNIIRYSFINSLRISIKKIIDGVPLQFLLFKLIFDFGIMTGLFFKNVKHNYAK